MTNTRFRRILTAGLFAFMAAPLTTAVAQSSSLSAPPNDLRTTADPEWVLGQMKALGVPAEFVTLDGKRYVETEAGPGLPFYILSRDCTNEAAQTGCGVLEVFSIGPGGLTLQSINSYHLEETQVVTVALLPDQRVLAVAKFFPVSGMSGQGIVTLIATATQDFDRVSKLPRSTLANFEQLLPEPDLGRTISFAPEGRDWSKFKAAIGPVTASAFVPLLSGQAH